MVSCRPESHLNLAHISRYFDVARALFRECLICAALRLEFSPA